MTRLLAAAVAMVGAAVLAAQQAEPKVPDALFRVAVLQSTARPPEPEALTRVFARANAILGQKTGEHMTQVSFAEVGRGNATSKAEQFIAAHPDNPPDGILILSDDEESMEYGGYSFDLPRPDGSLNRFPSPVSGAGRVYVAVIDFFHKYARCGYNDRGNRVSPYSRGGECMGQRGLTCVDNGRFWTCPGTTEDPNAEPDYFMGCAIVHEFVHPFGALGDDDHYRAAPCARRLPLSPADARNERMAQDACGMCPDVYTQFKRAH